MPGETPAQVPETVAAKPKKPSAGELFASLKRSLGFGPRASAVPAAAEAPIAATPPPAGEAAGAPPTPFDVLREAPAFTPVAEASGLPVNPASLLPPVSEEEWQRLNQAALARGSTGEAMAAASAEIPAPPPAPVLGGEPRDLDASEVAAMYGQDRKSADAARAESYRAETQAAHMEELPDWLQGGQGETPAPVPVAPSVAEKTGTAEGDARKGMGQFAAGLDASLEDKAREYAARIAVGEDPRTMGVPEALRPRVSQLVSRDKAAALEAPELSKEQGPVEALAPAPEVPSPAAPAEAALEPSAKPEAKKPNEELLIEALNTLKETFELIQQNRLTPEARKQALIAAAKSNNLIATLPKEIQQIIYISRAVAAQDPHYDRLAFQRDMLSAIKAIREAPVIEGESK